MRVLLLATVVLMLAGCAGAASEGKGATGAAALQGFGIDVDEAVAPRLPMVQLRTCGPWGCHEQNVPLHVAGPTSAMPCPSASAPADSTCSIVHLPGPGPGFGYAPVPGLTFDPVTVTVTTPPGAPLRLDAVVEVRPSAVCPDHPGPTGTRSVPDAATTCSGATPQAQLRIAADGTVSQSR